MNTNRPNLVKRVFARQKVTKRERIVAEWRDLSSRLDGLLATLHAQHQSHAVIRKIEHNRRQLDLLLK